MTGSVMQNVYELNDNFIENDNNINVEILTPDKDKEIMTLISSCKSLRKSILNL